MEILLIQAGTSLELRESMGKGNMNRINMPMLGLLYIEAALPKDKGYKVEVIDENHEPITNFRKYDIVGISGMTVHANRMYTLADKYRELGCHVVLGGVHVSFMQEEALQHADTVMIKEGELTWPEFLEDFSKGKAKRIYAPNTVYDITDSPRPIYD